jgi:signal peptidase I
VRARRRPGRTRRGAARAHRTPPRLATWLLSRYSCAYRRDALIGDLAEEYDRGRAPAWYWLQALQAIAAAALKALQRRRWLCALRLLVIWALLTGASLGAKSRPMKLMPPRLALWLIERLGARYRRESLVGDLLEEFARRRSARWMWHQAARAAIARVGALMQGSLLMQTRAARGDVRSESTGPQRVASSPRRRFSAYWQEYRGVLMFLCLMLGFRSAWADWVLVPSGSMNPTILEGDRILVDKHVYGLRVPFTLVHLTGGANPERGDIVVFDSPRDGTSLVKRVIGVPGDTIALDRERLVVNGVSAHYAPGNTVELRRLLAATRAHDPTVVRESGDGPAHDILLLPDRWAPSTYGPIIVPPGMYFVLGDNRDDSADSRYIGLVPRRNIVGRAVRIVVSLDPDRYDLPRSGRFLQRLD